MGAALRLDGRFQSRTTAKASNRSGVSATPRLRRGQPSGRRRQERREPCFKRRARYRPDNSIHLAALSQDHEQRNRLRLKALSEAGVGVDVDLDDLEPSGVAAGQALRAAWRARRRVLARRSERIVAMGRRVLTSKSKRAARRVGVEDVLADLIFTPQCLDEYARLTGRAYDVRFDHRVDRERAVEIASE